MTILHTPRQQTFECIRRQQPPRMASDSSAHDKDKIVLYQAPSAARQQTESSSSRPAVDPPTTASQPWLRFKQYDPTSKGKTASRASNPRASATTSANARPSSGRAQQANIAVRRNKNPARNSNFTAEDGQHVLVLPRIKELTHPDPFDAMPDKVDPYAARMLQLYIDKSLMTTPFSRSVPAAGKIWLEQRKQEWLPLAMTSPAAFNAVILYMETCPGMPRSPAIDMSTRRRLAMTYKTLNDDLKDSANVASDSTALAIVLLMGVAEHMDDFDAFCSHAFGLETLVARRKNIPAALLPRARPTPEHSQATIEAIAARNVLRPEFLAHLRYWQAAAMAFRVLARDDWMINLQSQHMMTTGFPFGGRLEPFEEALAETLKLNAVRHFPNKSPSITTGFKLACAIGHIRSCIEAMDLDHCLRVCPDIMIWVAVVVGPVASVPEDYEVFSALLRRAVSAVGNITYEQAREAMRRSSLLPIPFDDLSQQFWEHVVSFKARSFTVPEYLTPDESHLTAAQEANVRSIRELLGRPRR